MATLTVTGTHDYIGESLPNIDSIVFATTTNTIQTTSFSSAQFGPGLISNSVAITGDAHSDYVDVYLSAPGSFSAAAWTVSNWNAAVDSVQIYGTVGVDTITGSLQNDVISGGAGADLLNGGPGDDTFVYLSSGEVIAGESVTGGVGYDAIVIFDAGNSDFSSVTLNSIEELDLLDSQSYTFNASQLGVNGITHVVGDGGTAHITVADAFSEDLSSLTFLNWTAGTDTITITGTAAANVLTGSSQGDLIDGQGGGDTMAGGAGDDWYFVDSTSDIVMESVGQGNDRVFASVSYGLRVGQEVETLTTMDNAGTTALTLAGNGFDNAVFGNAGANVIKGGGGTDSLYGLGGDDQYFVDSLDDVVVEAVGGGQDRVFAGASYTLGAGQEIEKLTTTDNAGTGAINLVGNAFDNTIFGNAGSNVIKGGGGTDALVGLGGDDKYGVDSADDVVIEMAGGGMDQVFSSVDYTLGAGVYVETLSTNFSAGTDNLTLIGNELGETIMGNAGSNAIKGMAGNDVLYGGGGGDAFVFNTALDAINNVDTILDFSVADDDIVLASWIFTGVAPGTLSPAAFHVGSGAADASDRIIYNETTGQLSYDPDGVGGVAQTSFAIMDHFLALTNADFLVV